MDASYPSMVAHYLYKVGLIHGHAKIQYTMLSMVSRPFLPGSFSKRAEQAMAEPAGRDL